MEPWTVAPHAFAVKAFYKKRWQFCDRSAWISKRLGFIAVVLFHHPMPSTWVRNFEATGSTLKKKGGDVKTVRTPKNIVVVREAIERSPQRSERHHSVSLGLSEASVRWILHKDLHFYPHKKGLDGMGWWNSMTAMNPNSFRNSR
jgi:hypothetical protein